MTSDLDQRERAELCDELIEIGPDAPTLCGDWTTGDLAAHLAIRERDPRSAPGILFGGPFEGYTNKLMAKQLAKGFEATVDKVRRPPMGPLSIAPLRSAISLIEYTVHHEDVRRANGLGPREDRDDLQAEIWGRISQLGGLMARKARIAPVSLRLVATGSTSATKDIGGGDRRVTITGEPMELLLFLYGRSTVAKVELEGDAADVDVVRSASFGI